MFDGNLFCNKKKKNTIDVIIFYYCISRLDLQNLYNGLFVVVTTKLHKTYLCQPKPCHVYCKAFHSLTGMPPAREFSVQ